LYCFSAALAFWAFAWVMSKVMGTRKGFPTYMLLVGWACFVTYLVRIW